MLLLPHWVRKEAPDAKCLARCLEQSERSVSFFLPQTGVSSTDSAVHGPAHRPPPQAKICPTLESWEQTPSPVSVPIAAS